MPIRKGGDYFVHVGYGPKNRPKHTRSHTEGQRFYELKTKSGEWRISRLSSSPFFEKWDTYDPAGFRKCK